MGNREEDDAIPIMDAARVCSVSRRTIYNWLRDGKLTILRTPGGAIRIKRSELLRRAAGTSRTVRAAARAALRTPAVVAAEADATGGTTGGTAK